MEWTIVGGARAAEASLAEVVRAAERFGSRPFFSFVPQGTVAPEQNVTFAQYTDAALRLAGSLRATGTGPGSRVALVGRPDLGFVQVAGAALLLGATVLPVNHTLTPHEIGTYLGQLRCETVYTDPSTIGRVALAAAALPFAHRLVSVEPLPGTVHLDRGGPRLEAHAVDPDSIGVVLHTSGTTALPKAVVHTHANFLRFLDRWTDWVVGPDDRLLSYAPYYHQSGLLQNFLAALHVGAPITQLETFSARTFWESVRRAQATTTFFIPPVASYLLAAPVSPDDRRHGLTHSVLAGRSDHWAAFQERFGVGGHSGYASTETLVCTFTGTRTSPPVAAARLARPGLLAGTPWPHWAQVRVVDDDERPVPTGTAGRIQARGPALFRGYLDDAAATAAAFTADGWFRTGDTGYVHADGDLYLLGRTDELIRRSSEMISPAEIESVLLDHPDIVEAAVVPVPDAVREQEIRACVVPVPGATLSAADVFEHCATFLAPFKVPRYVEFRPSLPRTATMKVRRPELMAEGDPSVWIDRMELTC